MVASCLVAAAPAASSTVQRSWGTGAGLQGTRKGEDFEGLWRTLGRASAHCRTASRAAAATRASPFLFFVAFVMKIGDEALR